MPKHHLKTLLSALATVTATQADAVSDNFLNEPLPPRSQMSEGQVFATKMFNNSQWIWTLDKQLKAARSQADAVRIASNAKDPKIKGRDEQIARRMLYCGNHLGKEALIRMVHQNDLKVSANDLSPHNIEEYNTLKCIGFDVKKVSQVGYHPLTWLMLTERPDDKTTALAVQMLRDGAPSQGHKCTRSTEDILKKDASWRSALQTAMQAPCRAAQPLSR